MRYQKPRAMGEYVPAARRATAMHAAMRTGSGLAVLTALAGPPPVPMTVAELSNATGSSKPTIYRRLRFAAALGQAQRTTKLNTSDTYHARSHLPAWVLTAKGQALVAELAAAPHLL